MLKNATDTIVPIKDFAGCTVYSRACPEYNNKTVERTVRKAFPKDNDSTLYIVKVKGVLGYLALYEDEMIKC